MTGIKGMGKGCAGPGILEGFPDVTVRPGGGRGVRLAEFGTESTPTLSRWEYESKAGGDQTGEAEARSASDSLAR